MSDFINHRTYRTALPGSAHRTYGMPLGLEVPRYFCPLCHRTRSSCCTCVVDAARRLSRSGR